MARYGFIGCGNMGGALARALCQKAEPGEVMLCDRAQQQAEALAEELGCRAGNNERAARECAYIFLAVKPHLMEGMLLPLRPILEARKDRFILVSIAAGLSMGRIRELAGGDYPIIRLMPNTAALVGESMTLLCCAGAEQSEVDSLVEALSASGRFDEVEETLLDAGGCVSGCGPAFAYLYLEALADGAVACGVPRVKARQYAAQALLGAAKMALESGEHTAALKDGVCSPGGSTIEGVQALEEGGLRAAAMRAVRAAYDKTLLLGRK
ncbi:MAG: pyrroline-5-carboxylate reductase [Candidatus Pelethousia sp.]|nr:pyrroline-5-carboxylate reductase [Candidatus Pelethousia sp.]